MFPISKPNRVIYSILGLNAAVYLEWQRSKYTAKSKGDLNSLNFMYNNFTCSGHTVLKEGRIHTLLTSTFSHMDLPHFAFNMFALYSFGPFMVAQLGTRRFLTLYLGSGLLGSVSSVLYTSQTGENRRSLGASGSLMGILASFGMLFPNSQVYLLFFPVPAKFAVFGYAAYDFFMMNSRLSSTDHVGHLGGLFYGIVYTWLKFLR